MIFRNSFDLVSFSYRLTDGLPYFLSHTHTHTHVHGRRTYTRSHTRACFHIIITYTQKTIGAPAAASDIYSHVVDPVGLDPRLFWCIGGGRIFKIDAHAPRAFTGPATVHSSRPRRWQRQRIMLPLISVAGDQKWADTSSRRRPTGRPLLAVARSHIDDGRDNALCLRDLCTCRLSRRYPPLYHLMIPSVYTRSTIPYVVVIYVRRGFTV